MSPSILVLGAGELGLPILHSLANLSSTIIPPSSRPTLTVLLRPSTINSPSTASKAQELSSLRALGITFMAADISASTAAELASHFKTYDTVISCTGFSGGPGTQLKLAQAALEAEVKHYYPWQFGVDYDIIGPDAAGGLFREQCEVRQWLRAQQKTKWTIVSTGMFTSFLFEPFFGVVVDATAAERKGKKMIVRALGGWGNRVTVTTPEDIGKIVAALVLGDHKTGVVFTAGDTISYEQLADLVERLVGKEERVQREVWDLEYLRGELGKDPEDAIKKYRLVFAEGKGVSWTQASAVNVQLGIDTTDVERFLLSRKDVLSF
ncbi:MAG: hypothetical protein LQ341_007288 [Variospora aurantia]|nr:MAG: hypothetical protein LQ341_007288 [Variospora aurantia]